MIVYAGIKKDFLTAVEQDSIAAEIEENIYNKMHRRTAQNEFRSWENSLEVREYDVIKQNIDSILRQDREPERGKETERG